MGLWGDQSWYDRDKDGELTGWEKASWMAKQADEENEEQRRQSSGQGVTPGISRFVLGVITVALVAFMIAFFWELSQQ